MVHAKHTYALIEILKNSRIGQSAAFNGYRTPEEVKKNIKTFKFELDNDNKICIIAVVPVNRLNLPANTTQQEHEICALNLIKNEEVYYLGYPIDKNNQETKDPSKVAGVRIGRYIHGDFKPGDFVIHPLTGRIFTHFRTAKNLTRHQAGTRIQRSNTLLNRKHERTTE